MRRALRGVGTLAAGVLLSATLVACGSDDSKSPVCTDVDNLKESVRTLQDVKIGQGALTTIRDQLTEMRQELTSLKSDAKAEYSGEIAQVSASWNTLDTAVRAAIADPTAQTLAPVGPAVKSVSNAVDQLVTAVSDTC